MNLDEYQTAAAVFKFNSPDVPERWCLKLCAEAGEAAQIMERHVWMDRPMNPEDLKLELGDTLWYLAAMAGSLGMSLSEVAEANLAKLARRHSARLIDAGMHPALPGTVTLGED